MKSRNAMIDFIKGIAVVIIVLVHSLELFGNEAVLKSSFGSCVLFLGGAPVAPILLVIFGYYIYSSKKSQIQLLKRGLLTVLTAFVLNILLNANLLYKISNNELSINPYAYIFGADILHLAGIALIVCALLKPIFESSIAWVLLALILTFTTSKLVLHFDVMPAANYLSSFFFGNSNWSYFPFFNWFAYVLLGILLCKVELKFKIVDNFVQRLNLFALLIFGSFLTITIPFAIEVTSHLESFYHHGCLFFSWAIIFLLGYALLINKLNELLNETKIQKLVLWLGENITLIYFIQWLIIGNFGTSYYKFVFDPIIVMVIFISVLITSVTIAFLFKKITQKIYMNLKL